LGDVVSHDGSRRQPFDMAALEESPLAIDVPATLLALAEEVIE
jgi:hypothetical protein